MARAGTKRESRHKEREQQDTPRAGAKRESSKTYTALTLKERAARHASHSPSKREQQDIHRTHPQRESSKTCIALALASERDGVSGRARDR